MATDGATASDNSNAQPHDFTATSPKRYVMAVSMRRQYDRWGKGGGADAGRGSDLTAATLQTILIEAL
ncbi:unnamed protein product [Stenotrophomonas maltophilia]|nr:unnamed protein product [Stenotrophomonas maltophilia]